MSISPLAATTGVVTGINWSNIINEMMSVQEQPLTALQGQQSTVTQEQQVYTSLQSNLSGLQSAAAALRQIGGGALETSAATSSDASVASATAGSGSLSGSASLNVLSLASPSTASSSAPLFTGAGAAAGAPSIASAADIRSSPGFDPTASLASQAAYLGTAPGASGSISVNGAAVAWSASDSLDQVLGLINSASTGATATWNATSGTVELTGATKGSAAQLSLAESSGSLLEALGMAAGTATGTDAKTFDPTATLSSQASLLDVPVTAGTITVNGASFTVDPTTQSLDDLLQAFNTGSVDVQGQYDAGSGRLFLSTADQGASAALSLGSPGDTSNLLSAMKLGPVSAGKDAQVSVNGAAAQSVPSNTSDTLLPGASVVLTGLGSATVSVGPSASTAASAIEALVSAYNSAVTSVNGYLDQAPAAVSVNPTAAAATQAANADPGIQGAFIGNALLQQTADTLSTQVTDTQASGGAATVLSQIGITLAAASPGQPQTLTFNQSAFTAAYQSDPSSVSSLISAPGTGLADRLYNSLQSLVNPVNGSYTLQVNGENSELSDLGRQVSDMQTNLNYQQQQLQTQYAQLEATLGTMQSQGQQISGTLTTLSQAVVA